MVTPEPISGPIAAFAYSVGLYVIWVGALLRIAWVVRPKTVALWMVSILSLGVILDPFASENSLDIILIAVSLVPLAQHTSWRYAELSVVAFLAAFATMVKLNAGFEGVTLFLAVLAVTVYRDWSLSRMALRQALATLISLPLWIIV